MPATRRARVRALAKINLDLRVLGKRPDGYHELRTIFQTVSLSDVLELDFTPRRSTAVSLSDGGARGRPPREPARYFCAAASRWKRDSRWWQS